MSVPRGIRRSSECAARHRGDALPRVAPIGATSCASSAVHQAPKYGVLEIAKPTDVERQEAAYHSADLLLIEDGPHAVDGLHLAATRHLPTSVSRRASCLGTSPVHNRVAAPARDCIVCRLSGTSPYQEGWQVLHTPSVHPDDVDKAVHVLEKADIVNHRVSTRRS